MIELINVLGDRPLNTVHCRLMFRFAMTAPEPDLVRQPRNVTVRAPIPLSLHRKEWETK
jgi:hypothetical protein